MPKNIVLLSDGTGNSAAKPFKTNVWRLYQALNIAERAEPRQLVFYDNGVGTETLKPLALLGASIGLGLAQNVRDLYTFLCRNYERGDGIYLFGFSRGAFTVRVLSGLITRCGVVQAENESELEERVKAAYSAYRRDANRRATKTRPHLLAGRLLGGLGQPPDHIKFDFDEQLFPEIAFIGVWDTVDAYGLPFDELKLGIDRYIWPMTLADREVSKHVRRACQALSLDDERPTFRPVLWNEKSVEKPDRLTQLWFAGVHANVGGGYPDDGLAYVTLQWMMDEAEAAGLHFHPSERSLVDCRADPQGEHYDSRSGLAGYYRYGPRIVDELCSDEDHGVFIASAKVHESVQTRIADRQVAYAPVSFPTRYVAFKRAHGGSPPLVPAPELESNGERLARRAEMEAAWNAVWRRRLAYFATVALTIGLMLFPILERWPGLPPEPPISDRIAPLASERLRAVLSALPFSGFASWWIESFARHPFLFLLTLVALLWLFFRTSVLLDGQVFERAEYAWRRSKRSEPSVPEQHWSDPVISRVRGRSRLTHAYHWFSTRAVPLMFAAFVAPMALLVVPFLVPKMVREAKRRERYRPQPIALPVARIEQARTTRDGVRNPTSK